MDEQDSRDVRHILELLAVFPIPDIENPADIDTQFWVEVDSATGGTYEDSPRYIVEKMHGIIAVWSQSEEYFGFIGRYCLAFFAGELPDLWRLVGKLFVFSSADGDALTIGRIWAEDMTQTAWRLYLRHGDFKNVDGMIEGWRGVRPGVPPSRGDL